MKLKKNSENIDKEFHVFSTNDNLGKLGDFVWFDDNENGIQDAEEKGVEGVEINLLADKNSNGIIEVGEVVATTTTNELGKYSFVVTPGEYQIEFNALFVPDALGFTQPNAPGSNVENDSDAINDTGPLTRSTAIINIGAGETNLTIDAGLLRGPDLFFGNLGDFVWHDLNGNGIQDPNEPGIEGVTVFLLDENGSQIDETETDSGGFYEFLFLQAGDYQVQFTFPNGFEALTLSDQGNDDAVDSDADPFTLRSTLVTLAEGEINVNIDAGFYKFASLGDRVWEDENGNGQQDLGENGISGVEVELYECVEDQPGELLNSTTTDVNGNYNFTELDPGKYIIKFITPDGYSLTTANVGDDATDSDAEIDGLTGCYTLESGETNNSVDAGLVKVVDPEPGIDIEKFTNDMDVDFNNLPEIAAGADVTFTYLVTNTGNVDFSFAEVNINDNHGTPDDSSDDFTPTLVASSDIGSDGILSAGETWEYTSGTMAAQNLTTTTNPNNIQFILTGSSSTTGSYGNVCSFSAGGEEIIGEYKNTVTVQAGSVSDSDMSGYTNPASQEPPIYNTIRIEAEDLHRNYGYRVEHQDFASDGELIKLNFYKGKASLDNLTGIEGIVAGQTYDLSVGYYDENDGEAHASIKIGQETFSWDFDQHLGSNVASPDNFVLRQLGQVTIGGNDNLKLFGYQDGYEFARIDYVEFKAV